MGTICIVAFIVFIILLLAIPFSFKFEKDEKDKTFRKNCDALIEEQRRHQLTLNFKLNSF